VFFWRKLPVTVFLAVPIQNGNTITSLQEARPLRAESCAESWAAGE
jgi:hypothetical protein